MTYGVTSDDFELRWGLIGNVVWKLKPVAEKHARGYFSSLKFSIDSEAHILISDESTVCGIRFKTREKFIWTKLAKVSERLLAAGSVREKEREREREGEGKEREIWVERERLEKGVCHWHQTQWRKRAHSMGHVWHIFLTSLSLSLAHATFVLTPLSSLALSFFCWA